jgi:hypothetical protein
VKLRGGIFFATGLAAALAIGWLVFPEVLYEKIDQPLQFSHKIHTGDAVGLPCEECHSFRQDGAFTGIPKLEKCAGCHAQALGTSAEEKRLVDEFVTPGREIPWLVYASQPQNAYFSHIQHVRLGSIPCERCHGPHGSSDGLEAFQRNRISGESMAIWGSSLAGIKSGPWDGMKMDDCSQSHKERGVAESCLSCHK